MEQQIHKKLRKSSNVYKSLAEFHKNIILLKIPEISNLLNES